MVRSGSEVPTAPWVQIVVAPGRPVDDSLAGDPGSRR